MHGCSGSTSLVNAEVDSMGGVVDGVIGIGTKTSPRRAAIEKAQAELRQEYDVREERIRELEFLEKGGDPLDFKLGHAASVSVQSTSLTDQHPQIVTSEAKGSFLLVASPRGDSAESSGRPGGPIVCEANSADNLSLLFDGENELPEGERKSKISSTRSNVTPLQRSSHVDSIQNAKEVEDSAIFRPYARRNRSKSNRDGTRSTSTDVNSSRGTHGSLPARHGFALKDAKGLISETNNQKDQKIMPLANPKIATVNGDTVFKVDNCLNTELNGGPAQEAREASTGLIKGGWKEGSLPHIASIDLKDNRQKQVPDADVRLSAISPPGETDVIEKKEEAVSAGDACIPCATTREIDNEAIACEPNGLENHYREKTDTQTEGESGRATLSKNLDSESSCSPTILSLDGNNIKDLHPDSGYMDYNGNSKEHTLASNEIQKKAGGGMLKETNEPKSDVVCLNAKDDGNSVHLNYRTSGSEAKVEKEISESKSDLQNEADGNVEGAESNDHAETKADQKQDTMSGDKSNLEKGDFSTDRDQIAIETSIHEIPDAISSRKDLTDVPGPQTCDNHLKLSNKEHEDSVLAEARTIEAKRKRIAELSVGTSSLESPPKSHWDYVLEEMSWLANDFMQERIWKIAMSAQISRKVASASHLRLEDQRLSRNQRKVAFTLAKAVMQFWHSAELLLSSADPECHKHNSVASGRVDEREVADDRIGQSEREANKDLKLQLPNKNVKEYAVRFLEFNRSMVPFVKAEMPMTPEILSDLVIQEFPWAEHLTEECLFYTAPCGAMESYRKSIESFLVEREKTGSIMQEEVDTSMYDAFEELSQENAYDEDEGETNTYYLPGAFEGSKASKFAQKKRKNTRPYMSRPYDPGADSTYRHSELGSQQSGLMRKRPANNLNVVTIPTKRMRTASRQRVLSPFGAGVTGNTQAPFKTDASSGDTSSLQDDQSTLNGGSQIQNSLEVDSTQEFDKQFPYDSGEISTKPKKKKKAKHLNSTYDQRWQLGSTVPHDQRDQYKKRLEGPHFESNGCSGAFAQHSSKKPKIMKQSLDVTFDNINSMNGSIPSPVASQMSNMSNPNKFMKIIGGRDRGRKSKASKQPPGQVGSGSAWSSIEDQALVVLVHDLGPNWELVSDAINSTLQFKCIFRKPKECKERHNSLMDRTAGDGADSAEDSGSSQPYPSTLPGIPKGSARQLFQRLQGPVEEDTLKSHFEKIIMIGQKQHYRRNQIDNQDLKQILPVHNSHVIALSQVCPNNLNGGFLTPLDLCDAMALSPDVLALGYQGPQTTSGFPNQGSVPSILTGSGANPSLQGSAGMVLGNNLSSPSGPLNASVRDGRYGVPRTSLPVDEQQRQQHYNPMLSNRNLQQSNMAASGALSGTDRVRMLSGGNGMGMMAGMNNRSMPMSRPGFQGITSSSMLNSASMVGMPSPVNMHPGAGSGQVNSVPRPRDALNPMRPGQNSMLPEVQMQVTQGNNQVVAPFNGFSSNFTSQTGPTPGQTYPVHPHHQHQIPPPKSHALSNSHHPHLQGTNHAIGPQHPAYARLVKERQLQHQRIMQQQQQFSSSNGLMSQPQPSPSLQSNSQIQSQTSQPASVLSVAPSSPISPVPSQLQQKHHLPPHGLSRNHQLGASSLVNQMGKQRQRPPQQQPLQQSGRTHHPQHRQLSQAQQPGKVLKGMGRGNTLMHTNLSAEPSHLNGVSVTLPGGQDVEKGEQVMHLMQGQSLYSGSNLNPVPPSQSLVSQSSNQSQIQPKHFSSPPSAKLLQQNPSHSNNNNQGQVPSVSASHTSLASHHQMALPSAMASNHHQLPLLPQSHQTQVDQTQVNVQKGQNRHVNEAEQSQLDQDAVTSSPRINATSAISQTCTEPANAVPAISSSGISRWKGPESLSTSSVQNPTSPLGSIGSPPPTSSGGDPVQSIGQGEVQGQLSGSLPSHGHNGGEQWQQQTHPKQSQVPLRSHQQQKHQQPESPQQQQSQQQIQHLQAGKGSVYIGPTNS